MVANCSMLYANSCHDGMKKNLMSSFLLLEKKYVDSDDLTITAHISHGVFTLVISPLEGATR